MTCDIISSMQYDIDTKGNLPVRIIRSVSLVYKMFDFETLCMCVQQQPTYILTLSQVYRRSLNHLCNFWKHAIPCTAVLRHVKIIIDCALPQETTAQEMQNFFQKLPYYIRLYEYFTRDPLSGNNRIE